MTPEGLIALEVTVSLIPSILSHLPLLPHLSPVYGIAELLIIWDSLCV